MIGQNSTMPLGAVDYSAIANAGASIFSTFTNLSAQKKASKTAAQQLQQEREQVAAQERNTKLIYKGVLIGSVLLVAGIITVTVIKNR
jgi:hypothetical protein